MLCNITHPNPVSCIFFCLCASEVCTIFSIYVFGDWESWIASVLVCLPTCCCCLRGAGVFWPGRLLELYIFWSPTRHDHNVFLPACVPQVQGPHKLHAAGRHRRIRHPPLQHAVQDLEDQARIFTPASAAHSTQDLGCLYPCSACSALQLAVQKPYQPCSDLSSCSQRQSTAHHHPFVYLLSQPSL